MVNYDLLRKFFEDEATPEEISQIEKWRNRAVENEVKFQEIYKVWESDEVEATPEIKEQKPFIVRYKFVLIVLFFLIVSYVVSTLVVSQREFVEVKSDLTNMNLDFKDKSEVVLMEKSKLRYPKLFTEDLRKVELLDGNAKFKVQNDSRPFVVQVNEYQILNNRLLYEESYPYEQHYAI